MPVNLSIPAIKPEWIALGVAVGLAAVWLYTRRDRDRDGEADGLLPGIGYDLGRTPFDALDGLRKGVVGGFRDLIGLGASPAECCRVYRTTFNGVAPEASKQFKMWLYCDKPAYEAWRDQKRAPSCAG